MPFLWNLGSPFRRVRGELFSWDVAYFQHLIAELNALDPPATDPAYLRAKELIRIYHEDGAHVTRSNLLELEQTLLSLQPTEALIQRAPILRLRYKEVVGDAQNAVYTPVDTSKCAPGDESMRKALLQDLRNLVSGIHWRYVLLPLVDRIEKAITITVMLCVVGHTLLWALTLLITASFLGSPFLSMLATVVYAGIIGGYVSSLRRVQSIRPEYDSLMTIQTLQNSRYFLWLSPLLGAIFAVVLLLIFLGGLVSGTVFPNFTALAQCTNCPYFRWPESWPFLKELRPLNAEAYGKLFLWSFIAGFAERFVPDALDRVIQRGESATAQASGPTGLSNPPQPPLPPPAPPETKKNGEDKPSGSVEAVQKDGGPPTTDAGNQPVTDTKTQDQSLGNQGAAKERHESVPSSISAVPGSDSKVSEAAKPLAYGNQPSAAGQPKREDEESRNRIGPQEGAPAKESSPSPGDDNKKTESA